jgi:hypothetical protein
MRSRESIHELQIGFWEIKREKIGRFHPSELGNFDRERLTIDDRAVEEVQLYRLRRIVMRCYIALVVDRYGDAEFFPEFALQRLCQ